jgi:hypothetical protein
MLSLPDKLVPSIPDQLDSARSTAPHIQEITSKLDEAELDDDDDHSPEEGGAEDFGVEPAL